MLRALAGIARAPFLLLAVVASLTGIAAATWLPGEIRWGHAGLALVAAVLAHIAVNSLNEYVDFRTGLDLRTERTPFSGGSGVLPARPDWAWLALVLGGIALLGTIGLGLYLIRAGGVAALVLGLIGVALVVGYTPWINRNPWLCLIAPGLGFGPVVVAGTGVVLLGGFDARLLAAALPLFFLTNNLLLLNQFPDRVADASVGRRHLPIVSGTRRSTQVFIAFVVMSYASVLLAWGAGWLPATALLSLATLPLAAGVVRGAWRHRDDAAALVPVLGRNVSLVLLTGALLATGLFLGGPVNTVA